VTDEIVIGLIEEQLTTAQPGGGFIFDGFPRTLAQADALAALLQRLGQNLDTVIEMAVDDDALVARVSGRFTCGDCGEVYHDQSKPPKDPAVCDECGSENFVRRADDNAESLRVRLLEYYKKTSPLIGYYYAKGLLQTVNGLDSMDGVSASIRAALDKVEQTGSIAS